MLHVPGVKAIPYPLESNNPPTWIKSQFLSKQIIQTLENRKK